jgi:hypothetical protein
MNNNQQQQKSFKKNSKPIKRQKKQIKEYIKKEVKKDVPKRLVIQQTMQPRCSDTTLIHAERWLSCIRDPEHKRCRGISTGVTPTGLITYRQNVTVTIPASGQLFLFYTPENAGAVNTYDLGGSVTAQWPYQFVAYAPGSVQVNVPAPATIIGAPLAGSGVSAGLYGLASAGVLPFSKWRVTGGSCVIVPVGALTTQSGFTQVGGFIGVPYDWTNTTTPMPTQRLASATLTDRQNNITAFHMRWFPTSDEDVELDSWDPAIANNLQTVMVEADEAKTNGIVYIAEIQGSAGTQFSVMINQIIEGIPNPTLAPFFATDLPYYRYDALAEVNRLLVMDPAYRKDIIGPHTNVQYTSGFQLNSGGGGGGGALGSAGFVNANTAVKKKKKNVNGTKADKATAHIIMNNDYGTQEEEEKYVTAQQDSYSEVRSVVKELEEDIVPGLLEDFVDENLYQKGQNLAGSNLLSMQQGPRDQKKRYTADGRLKINK